MNYLGRLTDEVRRLRKQVEDAQVRVNRLRAKAGALDEWAAAEAHRADAFVTWATGRLGFATEGEALRAFAAETAGTTAAAAEALPTEPVRVVGVGQAWELVTTAGVALRDAVPGGPVLRFQTAARARFFAEVMGIPVEGAAENHPSEPPTTDR